MSQVTEARSAVPSAKESGRPRQERAGVAPGAVLHRDGRRAARGDDVQRSGRRLRRRLRRARGVHRRHGRADDLLRRLHRDVSPGDVGGRLLHVHLARPGTRPGHGRGSADRLLLHHLRGRGDGRGSYFASTSIEAWTGARSRLGLPDPLPGADDGLRLVPHRADRQDPRRRARRRGAGAAGPVRRDHRQRRRPGRLQRRAAEPGQHLRQRRGTQGVRRRGGRRRAVRRVLVMGRIRDGAQLRRGVPGAAADREGGDVRLGDRPRRLLRASSRTCSSPAGA